MVVVWTHISKAVGDPEGHAERRRPAVEKGGLCSAFAQWLVVLTWGRHFETAPLPILSCSEIYGGLTVLSLFSEDFFLS